MTPDSAPEKAPTWIAALSEKMTRGRDAHRISASVTRHNGNAISAAIHDLLADELTRSLDYLLAEVREGFIPMEVHRAELAEHGPGKCEPLHETLAGGVHDLMHQVRRHRVFIPEYAEHAEVILFSDVERYFDDTPESKTHGPGKCAPIPSEVEPEREAGVAWRCGVWTEHEPHTTPFIIDGKRVDALCAGDAQ